MGNTLSEVKDKITVAEIVHSGEKLILPVDMELDDAIVLLRRRKEYLHQVVNLSEAFDVNPLDGAHALDCVLAEKYGWTNSIPTPGFWGDSPPQLIAVETSMGVFKNVPWGMFNLPNVTGQLSVGTATKHGRTVFQITAQVRRHNEPQVQDLFEAVRNFLVTGSIYRGKAVKIRFKDEDGDVLGQPEIRFIDTQIDESMLIYSADIQASVITNLFTPIQRLPDLVAHGIPFKRGVLLGGVFGTGKTLAAKVASKYAVQNNITYIYVTRADELQEALQFATQYQSPGVVIFCEDIDRVMDGQRSVKMDDILNVIDGIDAKNTNIMVVLTTNFLNKINPAMLRPGRLDAVIEITPPDGPAVQRLLRFYGGDYIQPGEDLKEVGEKLAGEIPAVVQEVVKRAKLAQLTRTPAGEQIRTIKADALLEAAITMTAQLALLNHKQVVRAELSLGEQLEQAVTRAMNGTSKAVGKTHILAEEIRQRV